MIILRLITLSVISCIVSACIGTGKTQINTKIINLSTESCSSLEKSMVTSYIIVAAREAGARNAQKSAKFKKLQKINPKKADEIIDRIKKTKIAPYANKHIRIAKAYMKRCKWPSRDLEKAKERHPSELASTSL